MEVKIQLVKLSPQEIKERETLLEKFKNKQISYEEVIRLQQLLEKERQEATDAGKFVVVLGIGFLLGLIASYLSEEPKKKKRKISIF